MTKKTTVRMFCSALLFLSGWLSAAEYSLVKDGKAVSCIVVKEDAAKPVAYGAQELSLYVKKITGAEPQIGKAPVKGLYPVLIGTIADTELVKKSGIDASQLKEDGFAVIAKADGLYIIGQNPRGALYGCYEILKKYGGVRWLVPGNDGEYLTQKKDVAVTEQKAIQNPFLRVRKTAADEITAFQWLVRNKMLAETTPEKFVDPKTGTRTKQADLLDSMAVTGSAYGGHILTFLMGGGTWKNMQNNLDALFKEHPEYFPLIKGQRVNIRKGVDSPNPCISNPKLLDLLADNLYKYAKGPYGAQHPIRIGNNDTTVWCECDACKALDNPAVSGTKAARSDRYWYMVNEIAKRVWAKDPTIKLGGWAYQDFWYPPTKLKVDPRIEVMISYNNQCWRHSIQDPKCSVNEELRNIMKAWKKTGHPFVINRDEIGAHDGHGSPGVYYLPSEKILFENFKQYSELGFKGSSFCVCSPFPSNFGYLKKVTPYFGKNYFWYAMWQICYLSSESMWNPDFDFNKEYEEINRLYYGKAWDGGMKEFRQLLTKYFIETPGCMGWGLGTPLGRCLDQAGSEEKLTKLMEKAVEAAKTDSDPRALKHVLRDQEIFKLTWLAFRKTYVENFKELNVYKRTSPIKIDGVLNETDWKNAHTLSNFKGGAHTPKSAKVQQSYVRVVYDPDTLYIAVECMEPMVDKMDAGKTVKRDDSGWSALGNCVELLYNYPDMADSYFHLAINSNGQIIDAIHKPGARDTSFTTKAKYAVKVLKDRWVLEIAIPASEIGMKCFDGATWKLNVTRQRKLTTKTADNQPFAEYSSCSNGAFHGASNFVNLKFTPKQATGRNQTADNAAWKNANFNSVISDSKLHKNYRFNRKGTWKFEDDKQLVPKEWSVFTGSVGTLKKASDSDSDYYIQLEKGYLTQYYVSPAPGKIRITFRARGKDRFALWTCSFKNKTATPGKKVYGYDQLKKTATYHIYKLTPEWKQYTVDVKKAGVPTERVSLRFIAEDKTTVLDLDDVYVYPIPDDTAEKSAQ